MVNTSCMKKVTVSPQTKLGSNLNLFSLSVFWGDEVWELTDRSDVRIVFTDISKWFSCKLNLISGDSRSRKFSKWNIQHRNLPFPVENQFRFILLHENFSVCDLNGEIFFSTNKWWEGKSRVNSKSFYQKYEIDK